MLDCVVYVSSVANPHKHPRKVACLESFARGVSNLGHTVKIETSYRYTPSRVAVILGWISNSGGGKNIELRRQIISEQALIKRHTMCIDASCWKYIDTNSLYLRYSIGGPFYDRAEYANANSTNAKWNEISQQLGVRLQEPKSNADGHILVCMQRDGGFAMKNLNPMAWTQAKIQEIRRYTDRPIKVRPHPGAYNMKDFDSLRSQWNKQQVTVLHPEESSLFDNLQGAHSAVFFNSSASVAAVCEGIPIFVDDRSCVSFAVANTDVANIESPEKFNRDQWLWDLAAAHWSDTEGAKGRIWQKFTPFIF